MSTPTPTPRPALKATGMRRRHARCLETELAALTAERDQLRAEVERLRSDRDCEKRLRKDAEELREDAIERAMKAEAELAAAKERLRSEAMDDYAAIKDLQRELATEREKVTMLLSDAYALTKNWHDRAESAEREVERLRAGIGECLRTNGHLADGDNCTLIGLKRCFNNPTAARESNGGAA